MPDFQDRIDAARHAAEIDGTAGDARPAAVLQAAADKLRALVQALGDNRGPWHIVKTERGYPQPIGNMGVPYVVADCFEEPTKPLTIAPYIVAMHPGVGAALADWLDSLTGIEFSEHGSMPDEFAHALAVARAIFAEEAFRQR
ncbi:MAG TPA: hypothetical protein VFY14_20635 [Streptomyces sp.]|nr:hypothetical protein [Streptomyces sp.]